MSNDRFTTREKRLIKIFVLPFYLYCLLQSVLYHYLTFTKQEDIYAAVIKGSGFTSADSYLNFHMIFSAVVFLLFIYINRNNFKLYQALGSALIIPLYWSSYTVIPIAYMDDELTKGEKTVLVIWLVMIVYSVVASLIGAVRAIKFNDELGDNSEKTIFVGYCLSWLYIAIFTLPELLKPLSFLLDRDALEIVTYPFDMSEGMGLGIYLPFMIYFAVFMVLFGLSIIKKSGIARTLITVAVNIVLPFVAMQAQGERSGETKRGVLILMLEILVMLFTLSTVVKAKGSESKLTKIIEKATPFVAAAAIAVMLVSVFIPAEKFNQKKNSNETLDLSQYTVSDIADMPSDELGELLGKYNDVYAPFG